MFVSNEAHIDDSFLTYQSSCQLRMNPSANLKYYDSDVHITHQPKLAEVFQPNDFQQKNDQDNEKCIKRISEIKPVLNLDNQTTQQQQKREGRSISEWLTGWCDSFCQYVFVRIDR